MPKKVITIFTVLITLGIFTAIFSTNAYTPSAKENIDYKPQVNIPGMQGETNGEYTVSSPGGTSEDGKAYKNSTLLPRYIEAVYKYAIGVVGILATVVMMYGGVLWIVSTGNAERVGEAKAWIGAALSGLVLTLSSYTILYLVNPDLLTFKPLKIQNLEKKILTNGQDISEKTTEITITFKNNASENYKKSFSQSKCSSECNGDEFKKEEPTLIREVNSAEGNIQTYSCTCKANNCIDNNTRGECKARNGLTGFCYLGKCYTGEGEVEEPCGVQMNGTCRIKCLDSEQTTTYGRECINRCCTTDTTIINFGGP